MASRILLNIDAKADKALAEIEKMKGKLKATNKEASGIGKAFDGIGDRVAGMVGPMAIVLSTATAVRAVFQEWRRDVDATRASVERANELRRQIGGAGNLSDLPQLRTRIQERKGIQPESEDTRQFGVFKGAFPSASADTAFNALGTTERAAAIGLGDPFVRSFANLQEAGIPSSRAADISARLTADAGQYNEAVSKSFGQLYSQLGSEDSQADPLVEVLLAGAESNQESRSIKVLVSRYKQSGFPGDFRTWIESVDTSTLIPTEADIVTAIRTKIGGVRRGTRKGRFASDFSKALADPQTALAIGKSQAERRLESNRAEGNLAQQQSDIIGAKTTAYMQENADFLPASGKIAEGVGILASNNDSITNAITTIATLLGARSAGYPAAALNYLTKSDMGDLARDVQREQVSELQKLNGNLEATTPPASPRSQ